MVRLAEKGFLAQEPSGAIHGSRGYIYRWVLTQGELMQLAVKHKWDELEATEAERRQLVAVLPD
jgi:hypothetical protein